MWPVTLLFISCQMSKGFVVFQNCSKLKLMIWVSYYSSNHFDAKQQQNYDFMFTQIQTMTTPHLSIQHTNWVLMVVTMMTATSSNNISIQSLIIIMWNEARYQCITKHLTTGQTFLMKRIKTVLYLDIEWEWKWNAVSRHTICDSFNNNNKPHIITHNVILVIQIKGLFANRG